MKHEALTMEHKTDPLCAAIDNWVGYLTPHPISSPYQPFQ